MLTPHCSAASGMVAPPSITSTTRIRKSSESGFAIHAGLLPAGSLNHILPPMGIPRFSLFGKRSNNVAEVGNIRLRLRGRRVLHAQGEGNSPHAVPWQEPLT